ncbi:MAG: adenylate/guanylate cyclase domain-containing protein [Sneathiella sp.]
MSEKQITRRLAAVFATDVVGYSRLMGIDEVGTLQRMTAHIENVFKPAIEEHNGQVVKTTGDGLLVEFSSAVDAVECAVHIQKQMVDRTNDEPEDLRVTFRIGINLGDIIIQDGDIFGEGVNIAARLEGLADAGGICISGDVHSQVHNRIDAEFHDRGEQQVKNISQPIRVYAIGSGLAHSSAPNSQGGPKQQAEKASIAILPFDNMSNDPEQEYFCDGMVEDIITEISKFRWLKVIARNSTFTYKGKSFDVKTVGEEMGARYVVEGSVRKAGNRIRINAQLIDSTDGSHIWAERYDRELADIFDLQDEITQTLVATIEPELAAAERTRVRKKPTENLDAWDLVQKASWYRNQFTAESYAKADLLLDKAISLDSEIPYAYALKGYLAYASVIMGYSDDPGKSLQQGITSATKAITLDDREILAYRALGSTQSSLGQYDEALKNFDKAIAINPNYAEAYHAKSLSMVLAPILDGEAVKRTAEIAIRLSPKDINMWSVLNTLGMMYAIEGDLEKAEEYYRDSCRQPVTTYFPFFYLAVMLKLTDRHEEAARAFSKAMEMNPTFTLTKQSQQIGKHGVARVESFGGIHALTELGLPDA